MAETTHAWEQGADGTYTVRNVPVFELGEHRGFRYDESWARQALRNFARLKRERSYLPPVILGHTRTDDEEKPAIGFMDRLRLVGRQIVADLTGIGREVFEQLRAGRWPYRSVEVFDRAAQITALALLGGTPPHMKTAPLHFSDDGGAGIWIHGGDLPRLTGAAGHHDTECHSDTDGGSMADNGNEPTTRFTQDDVDRLVDDARREEREKFRETEDALKSAEGELASMREEARKNRAQAFQSRLGEHGYAPAIADLPALRTLVTHLMDSQPVRFNDRDTDPLAILEDVLHTVADRASSGTAFVDLAEHAHSPARKTAFGTDEDVTRFDGVVDPASLERYRQARDLANTEGISFRDALKRVIDGTESLLQG